jgi:hypothetical protein
MSVIPKKGDLPELRSYGCQDWLEVETVEVNDDLSSNVSD